MPPDMLAGGVWMLDAELGWAGVVGGGLFSLLLGLDFGGGGGF